jgi:NhaP-type Na+/H+ or K+/H+ antiporter
MGDTWLLLAVPGAVALTVIIVVALWWWWPQPGGWR